MEFKSCCANCQFFRLDPEGSAVAGDCRRYPPVSIELGDDLTFIFPDVFVDEYCGEHRFDPKKHPLNQPLASGDE
jgi:hypothetical protein